MSRSPIPELFRHFPELRRILPWTALAQPTPVEPLCRLESHLRGPGIWVKRDDLTSHIHGGAQARKLEFVFGDILRRGARRLLAFGTVDSRDCLAVTAFAHHFHVRAVLALSGRPAAEWAQRTLRLEHELGAELHRVDGGPRSLWRLGRSCLGGALDERGSRLPYILWPRRAALLGTLGYVNAAYELQRQIGSGILPEPERIYVSTGSGATLAGLALGCDLAGIHSRLVAVVARGRRPVRPIRLARGAARFLRHGTSALPALRLRSPMELRRRDVVDRHPGPSVQGLLRDLEGLDLDAATTATAMAELLDDCRGGRVEGPVLFWNTDAPGVLSRVPTSPAAALPPGFRELFAAR